MQYLTKLFTVIVVYLGSFVNLNAEDSKEFGETVGMLNKGFSGFTISRDSVNNENISALIYEFPLQGFESDSKQNLRGVVFVVDKNGKIIRVLPKSFRVPLLDQNKVNLSISSGQKTSEFFTDNSIEGLGDLQLYGLLSKWAAAILARENSSKNVATNSSAFATLFSCQSRTSFFGNGPRQRRLGSHPINPDASRQTPANLDVLSPATGVFV